MADQPTPLRDYQIADLAFYLTQPRVGNFADPGTGKTPPTCVYSFHRWQDDKARTIWVQPSSLIKKNWEEMIRFTPFSSEDVAMLRGTPKQRAKILAGNPRVMLTTAQTLANMRESLQASFPDIQLVIGDEWHMLYGGDSAQRTQELYEFMRRCKYLVAMTGTMINGRLDSCYPWVKLVEPRYYGTYQGFKNYHYEYDEWGTFQGYRNFRKVASIFGRHSIRRTFESVFGPEAKVLEVERVEMAPRQREAYDKLHKEAVLELENAIIDGTLPGVNVIRCRQIMAHPEAVPVQVGFDEEKQKPVWQPTDIAKGERTGKDERLIIHATDHINTGKPFVVFAALVPEQLRIARLLESMGLKVGLINGSVSPVKRSQIDEAFRAGEIQVIVGSPATAAVGFNWQLWGPNQVEVEHVIFASMDYLDTTLMQAYRRFMRDVRKTPLRITILQYERSIDQRIYQVVYEKSFMASQVDPTRQVFRLASNDDELLLSA